MIHDLVNKQRSETVTHLVSLNSRALFASFLLLAMSSAKCKTAANLAAAIEAAHYEDKPRRMLTLLEEIAEITFSEV
jgi:hypothetical protein